MTTEQLLEFCALPDTEEARHELGTFAIKGIGICFATGTLKLNM